jgi:hypothetical protein
MADDAVRCEPLSAPNSLLNREITGNFLDLDLNHADPASKKPPAREVFLANSLLGGTGNFEGRTGDSFSASGNFQARLGTHLNDP